MKSDLHKVLHPVGAADAAAPDGQRRAGAAASGRRRGHGRDQLEKALGGRAIACRSRKWAPATRARRAGDFAGDVLILYGDVPFVRAQTMQAMLDRLHAPDAPGGRAGVPAGRCAQYGRVIAQGDRVVKMVEQDATDAERACTLCNSGLMAVKGADLFALLAQWATTMRAILPDRYRQRRQCPGQDLRGCGHRRPDEVAGINSRGELAPGRGALAAPSPPSPRWPMAPRWSPRKPCVLA
jgi:bifunctional UDP-N-acetylglucosamine pyrophosphorylase/glucosamine-1-phosphate N-acetyltransferase